MGVSKNSGTPKWMVIMEKPYSNGCFGVPLFLETSISTNNTSIHSSMPRSTWRFPPWMANEDLHPDLHQRWRSLQANAPPEPHGLPISPARRRWLQRGDCFFIHRPFVNPLRWGVSQVCCVCAYIYIYIYTYIYFSNITFQMLVVHGQRHLDKRLIIIKMCKTAPK